MDSSEAINVLFDNSEKDFSAEGFLEAISRLRNNSPGLANQVERALEPTLRKSYPRRKIAWHETSMGTVLRLKLLSHNPHFKEDAASVRDALGIQGPPMHSKPGESLFESLLPWKDDLKFPVDVVAGRELASQWIRQHKRSHKDLPTDQLSPDLRPGLIREARRSAKKDLSKIDIPEWLGKEHLASDKCKRGSDMGYPLHRAVSGLLGRYL